MSAHTPVPIPYKAPIDWGRWGTVAFVAITFLACIRHVLPVLQSRWMWAALTVGVSLVMTSGFMFVRIRGMPFTGGDGNWIASGYSNQYGQETQVVAMICEHTVTRPFLHGSHALHRRSPRRILPYAHARCSNAIVTGTPTCSGVSLDGRHPRRLLYPHFLVQG